MRLVRMMVSSVLCAAPLMAQQGADTLARIAGATVAAPNTEWVRVRGSASMTLRQPVSLALHGATVADALAELGRASGLRFYYGADVQKAAGRISLHVDNLPLAQALDDILDGTGLEAFVATHGTAVLIRRADVEPSLPTWQPGTGTITDHVADAALTGPSNAYASYMPKSISTYGTDVAFTLPTPQAIAQGDATSSTNPNYKGCTTSTKTA